MLKKKSVKKICDGFNLFLSNFNLRLLNIAKAVKGLNRNIALLIEIPLLDEQIQIAALFQSIETAMEQVEEKEKQLKASQKRLWMDY